MQHTIPLFQEALRNVQSLPLTDRGKAELSGFTNQVINQANADWLKLKYKWPSITDPFRYFMGICNSVAKKNNSGYNIHRAPAIAKHLKIDLSSPKIDNEAWAEYLLTIHSPQKKQRSTSSPLRTPSYINNHSCDCTPFIPQAPKFNEKGATFLRTHFPDFEKKISHRGNKKLSAIERKVFTCSCNETLCDNCQIILMREHKLYDFPPEHTQILSQRAGTIIQPNTPIHERHCSTITTDPYRPFLKRYTLNEYKERFVRRD